MATHNNLGITDELLIDALTIAQAQRTRAANGFKPGTAARAELEGEAAQIALAVNTLKANLSKTPLEEAAARGRNK